jgi:hypothetical protein
VIGFVDTIDPARRCGMPKSEGREHVGPLLREMAGKLFAPMDEEASGFGLILVACPFGFAVLANPLSHFRVVHMPRVQGRLIRDLRFEHSENSFEVLVMRLFPRRIVGTLPELGNQIRIWSAGEQMLEEPSVNRGEEAWGIDLALPTIVRAEDDRAGVSAAKF